MLVIERNNNNNNNKMPSYFSRVIKAAWVANVARVRAARAAAVVLLSPSPSSPRALGRGLRPAATVARRTSCLGCACNALAGRFNGQCLDIPGRGSRCWGCSSGHFCQQVLVLLYHYLPLILSLIYICFSPRRARFAARSLVAFLVVGRFGFDWVSNSGPPLLCFHANDHMKPVIMARRRLRVFLEKEEEEENEKEDEEGEEEDEDEEEDGGSEWSGFRFPSSGAGGAGAGGGGDGGKAGVAHALVGVLQVYMAN